MCNNIIKQTKQNKKTYTHSPGHVFGPPAASQCPSQGTRPLRCWPLSSRPASPGHRRPLERSAAHSASLRGHPGPGGQWLESIYFQDMLIIWIFIYNKRGKGVFQGCIFLPNNYYAHNCAFLVSNHENLNPTLAKYQKKEEKNIFYNIHWFTTKVHEFYIFSFQVLKTCIVSVVQYFHFMYN